VTSSLEDSINAPLSWFYALFLSVTMGLFTCSIINTFSINEFEDVLFTIVLLLLADVVSSLDRVGAVTDGAPVLLDSRSRNESSLLVSGFDLFPK